MAKSLIIKSTYSRLSDGTMKSNWGDLLRSTVLLECIGNSFLWLTDQRGKSLLRWFVEPENIITFDEGIHNPTSLTCVDIYNIDNFIYSHELHNCLKGNWRGFFLDKKNNLQPDNKMIALTEPYCSARSEKYFQQALVEGMGFQWKNQDYAQCRVEQKTITDIGLNWHVHNEWRSKRWPRENWEELAETLQKHCSVSWQKGINNFDEYINWIASCKIIVTQDTLGLHLASALRKMVLAITGSTESREFPYDRLILLKPAPRACMPCNLPACKNRKGCLPEIKVESVSKAVIQMLSKT